MGNILIPNLQDDAPSVDTSFVEWLVLLGLFVFPVGVAAINVWLNPGRRSLVHLGLSALPLILAIRILLIILSTERSDPSTLELILPFLMLLAAFAYMWFRAYQKDPKATMNLTAAVGFTAMGVAATRKFQKMRDQERASAIADELARGSNNSE